MKRTFKYLTLSAVTVLSVNFMQGAYAQTACKNTPVNIKVTARPLNQALTEFSKQIDCKLSYQPALVKGLKANNVAGKIIPFNGLTQLIKGSGLEVHVTGAGFELNQDDQKQIGLKAATLQAHLNQAVKSQKLKQGVANDMYAQLAEVRSSVIGLAKSQGFVSAAEKASYERSFKQAQQLLSVSNKL